MQDVVPEDLGLRDAEEVVRGLEEHGRLVRVQRQQTRGVNRAPEDEPLARRHVVGAERVDAVVLARGDVHGVDHDESQIAILADLGRLGVEEERKLQVHVLAFRGLRARVDEDERAAHEADFGNGLIEQLLQSVASLFGLELLEHLGWRVLTARDLDPFAGYVVRDGLDAVADHAVLGDLLQSAVADEARHRELTHSRRVFRERAAHGVKPHGAGQLSVERNAFGLLAPECLRERVGALDVRSGEGALHRMSERILDQDPSRRSLRRFGLDLLSHNFPLERPVDGQ